MVAGGRELIDTLWNVNDMGMWKMTKQEAELIDTLWNVNAVTEAMPDLSLIHI